MQQRILVEIDLGGASTKRIASEDLEYGGYHYVGWVIDSGNIEESMSEFYFGSKVISPITITLDNTKNQIRELRDTYELRGQDITIKRVDIDTDTLIETNVFRINGVVIEPSKGTIQASKEELEIWDKTIPSTRITEDDFENADESALGRPIHTWFGGVNGVPLYFINDDTTNNYYDYLIGWGDINAVSAVYRDDVLVSSAEYTVYDGSQSSPHGGYAFIRYTVEQRDANGNLYTHTANIQGLKIGGVYERNPATCFKEFLTNTDWGLGLTANTSSFATAINLLSQSAFWMKGGFWEFKKASEWRDYFLIACTLAQLNVGTSGYEIYVPRWKSSVTQDFEKYNITVVSDSERMISEYIKEVVLYYNYNVKESIYNGESRQTTGKNFGNIKEFYSPFTYQSSGGQTIAILLKNRFKYQDRHVVYEAGQDARALEINDIVRLTHADLGLSNNKFEVLKTDKRADIINITSAKYSNDIFRP